MDRACTRPTGRTIRLLTDTAGQFFGGGPFQGPYGNGGIVAASGQITGAVDTLWNKPVYVTGAIGGPARRSSGESAAQVWTRGGLSVEARTRTPRTSCST